MNNNISQITKKTKDFVSPAEAAEMLGVQASTLASWRCTKKQVIPFYKFGRTVKYKIQDLEAWTESRKVG